MIKPGSVRTACVCAWLPLLSLSPSALPQAATTGITAECSPARDDLKTTGFRTIARNERSEADMKSSVPILHHACP